jgi:carboxyl-terminal processing protease
MKALLSWIGVLLLLLFIFSAGAVFGAVLLNPLLSTVTPRALSTQGPDLELIEEAWKLIDQHYVDRSALQPKELTYGAISGMVSSLGDIGHTTFLSPEMLEEQHSFTQGEFEGIGAFIEMRNGMPVIVAPIDGSPAKAAGVMPGDVIVQVDGVDVEGMTVNEVVSRVKGPAGTQVELTLLNPQTGDSRNVHITRARVVINNVTWAPLPGTDLAQVRIAAFSEGVTHDLIQALKEIKQQNAKGIVLDLRNDPGGLLDEAVGVASQFLSTGDVMLMKDAQGKITPLPVESGGEALDIPMVVLINQGSASAAEIVSGALHDHDRAQLVGETTFGTGTVLNEFRLADGSGLLLATQEWLTPDGNSFWHQGIEPDIQVSLPESVAPLLPETVRTMDAEDLQQSQDTQLLKAIDLLQ